MSARQSKTPQPSQSISIPPAHSQPQVQAQVPQTFQMPSQQQQQQQQQTSIGQENVVRVFDELMKNIARMKMFVRPSMCKPYGKQSESLQKSEFSLKICRFLHERVYFLSFWFSALIDTIQIVQSLRNCIPAPTIPISSNAWKSDDRNSKYLQSLIYWLKSNFNPHSFAAGFLDFEGHNETYR